MNNETKPRGLYLATIERFAELDDCVPSECDDLSPIEFLISLPAVQEIAKRFEKAPEEVVKDIANVYLDSYRGDSTAIRNILDCSGYIKPVRPGPRRR